MTCDGCEVKRAGACTAHGGIGAALARAAIEEPMTVEKFAQTEGGDVPAPVPVRKTSRRPIVREEPIPAAGLKEEETPGCFGAIGMGIHHREGCPCTWAARCRQSQKDT